MLHTQTSSYKLKSVDAEVTNVIDHWIVIQWSITSVARSTTSVHWRSRRTSSVLRLHPSPSKSWTGHARPRSVALFTLLGYSFDILSGQSIQRAESPPGLGFNWGHSAAADRALAVRPYLLLTGTCTLSEKCLMLTYCLRSRTIN